MVSLIGVLFYFLGGEITGNKIEKVVQAKGLHKLASLPGALEESSGIEVLGDGHYITLNDAGNSPHLYQLDASGKIVNENKLHIPNVDWEDMTRDSKGNLYIADTGNNDNDRKELAIYKLNNKDLSSATAIRFTYEDQQEFPPSKKDRNFDSEAVFWQDGNIYIITKDRGQEKKANVYQVPDEPGKYKAKLIGSADINGLVTSAAISPDGKLVVLLENETLHFYRNFKSPATFYEGKPETVNLKGAGQTEAVAFEDDNTLIITSEGGNLYRYELQ